MKVLYINTLFYPLELGGAEKSLRNLILALKNRRHVEPVVVTLNEKSSEIDLVEDLDDIRVYRLGYRNTKFIFDKKGSLASRVLWHLNDYDNRSFDAAFEDIFQKEKPDLVHTNNLLGFSARPIYLARTNGIPVIHTLRDYYFQCWKSNKFRNDKNCESRCIACSLVTHKRRIYSNMVNAVIGNSSFILNDHLNDRVFSSAERQSVIYNIYECEEPCRPRNISQGSPLRLGYMGRLNREKGIRQLVDLVAGLNEYELLVAGSGELTDYVASAAMLHSNIFYRGHVEPKVLLTEIDILIVPSLWNEPLSRTIFEAYSFGIPVIGSTCGGTPEIIKENVTGALFDPRNFSSLIPILERIRDTTGLYADMSSNCLSYAQNFSKHMISKLYMEIYERVVTEDLPLQKLETIGQRNSDELT